MEAGPVEEMEPQDLRIETVKRAPQTKLDLI